MMKSERGYDQALMPYEEALARVMEAVTWRIPAETVPVLQSLGRVLREDVKAGFNIPPFNKSAMDGYAVRAEDTRGASHSSPISLAVIEDVPAGKSPKKTIGKGQASRAMTGAPMPKGADAVVMVEFTERDDDKGSVRIMKQAGPGDNTGRAGEDVEKGRIVLEAGTLIGPARMGMLAALGKSKVKVSKAPRALIISTGDEIVAPGKKRRAGQIYDANGYSLLGLAKQHGCNARFAGIVPDRPGALEKKLASADADLVLMTGGVSVGDYDFVTGLLRSLGIKEIFYKSKIKPGKPTFAGKKGRTLFFGLPGNPVSCMVCFELFVRPAIDKLRGKAEPGMKRGRAVMDADFKVKPGRRKFLRASLVGEGPHIRVRPYHDQKSGVLYSMLSADVLIEVPDDANGLSAGQEVYVWWLGEGPCQS